MREFPRREFCALLAASMGATTGCDRRAGETARGDRARSDAGDVTVASTRRELEAAFEDLSRGDTVRITDENAPYRTTRWLDIDADGVTVVGAGVRNLIEPAEGAEVGGIRIGHNDPCREIDVRGVGFRGTPSRDQRAERLHGIVVRNASNVTLERNYVRRTYPVKHGDGGSGISVTRQCSDVRVANNQIHEFGDRGIQLGGQRAVVFGNVVAEGLDRPISCDLWYPDAENRTAQHVSIFGNLVGNSVEGSLVGVARNTPLASNEGYVSIFGNVGFGTHKSFCHVRGPEAVRNISVQHNVNRQKTDDLRTEQTTEFAGVAVDAASGRNVSIKNNELYDYSGHGVHVNSEITDLSVEDNGVYTPGLAGVRLVGASAGTVAGNVVSETGDAGVRLKDAANVVVRGNYIRRTGGPGIVSGGSDSATGNDLAGNYLVGVGQTTDDGESAPGIDVRDGGVRVRGNAVHRVMGPAVDESPGATGNVYADNWTTGEAPWRIRSGGTRTRSNTPAVDAHRGVTAGGDGVAAIEFDRPYVQRPRLSFGRVAGGIGEVRYLSDENGDYVGARIGVEDAGGTIDAFVGEQ